MDETRRFLRFVIPGLTIIFEGFLIAFLDHKLCFIQENADFGTVLTAFFASGLIGFLFSNVYYPIYWKVYLSKLFKQKRKLNYIKLVTENQDIITGFKVNQDMSQKEAWSIINTFFNLNHAEETKFYERKTDNLSNLLASIGTTILILLVCSSVGLIYVKHKIIFSLINIFFIFFLASNYVIASSILQHLYEKLFEWLKNKPEKSTNTDKTEKQ